MELPTQRMVLLGPPSSRGIEVKQKTLQCGFTMPALGMGTWEFGGRDTRNPDNDDVGQVHALQAGIKAGLTLIDTAEYYAEGHAETLIGQAIAGYPREKLFLTSKVWKTHLGRDSVLWAAEQSLRRLRTDYLDLYLYHQVSEEVPLPETIGAMNELVVQGMVRNIGVSNFAVPRLQRAMACSSAPIVVNQVHYSLVHREPELGLLTFCQGHDVMLQAWRPLRGVVASELTDRLCRQYGCTLPQLALAWLLGQRQVTTMTAMRNPKHVPENAVAVDLVLAESDIELLRTDMPGLKHTSAVPLR